VAGALTAISVTPVFRWKSVFDSLGDLSNGQIVHYFALAEKISFNAGSAS
jgi:hypothetical protein